MQSNGQLLSTLTPHPALAGRTALVTGATSGIGEAIARVLAASGATVAVHGRDEERADAVVSAVTAAGGKAHAVTGDLAGGHDQVRGLAERATEVLGGRVDVLVNNAGLYPVSPTEAATDDDVDAMLAVNVRAPHVLVAALAPAMAERGDGAVVNIGSWMARTGVPFGAMYTATKAALEQMTRTWAAEYGPRGVRAVTVAPGATATPGNAGSADAVAAMTSGTPAGVPVRPVDVARAVRWVVSEEGAFLHGSIIDVDGGISATRGA
ncbi:SDR family NAD(P)-dependent oxidoreductase [Aquipuribacter sp. SD81]|uniref:SDR family NAD(P)-dependent oxidoreductase n=1 Tax=Aquipuribacter sp. SD81 TaxID=3127703 RepID=UPI003019F8F1